jgi:hypothetical protein
MEVQDVGLNNDIFTKFQTPLTEDQKNKLREIAAGVDYSGLVYRYRRELLFAASGAHQGAFISF